MANVQTSIDIAAPVQPAWELVTDLERLGDASENGGTRFQYRNEFELPAGELGQAASGVVAGYAEREAESSLARLKQIAEG